MTPAIHRLCVLVAVWVISYGPSLVYADDLINIRFVPGMPRLDLSAELANVRVERMAPVLRNAPSGAIDEFFNAVRRVLSDNDVTGDWVFTGPDAPCIEITIELDGKRINLVSWHTVLERNPDVVATEHGIESLAGRDRVKVLARQSERFRKNRRAFEQLLALVSERLRAKFGTS